MGEPAHVVWCPHADDPHHTFLKVRREAVEVVIVSVQLYRVVILSYSCGVGGHLTPFVYGPVLSHSEWMERVDGILLSWSELVSMGIEDVCVTGPSIVALAVKAVLIGWVASVSHRSE